MFVCDVRVNTCGRMTDPTVYRPVSRMPKATQLAWAVRTGSRAVWVTPASQRENPKENELCFRVIVFRSRNPSVVSFHKNCQKITHVIADFSKIITLFFTKEVLRNDTKHSSTHFLHDLHYVSITPADITAGVHLFALLF